MIEKIVLDYLADSFDCPVVLEVPSDPPTRFIVLEKTGSGLENHINRATIAIQSYAESLYEAAALNKEVIAVMNRIIEGEHISNCSLNSDYNFTDVSTKKYRYQAVFDLVY